MWRLFNNLLFFAAAAYVATVVAFAVYLSVTSTGEPHRACVDGSTRCNPGAHK